MPLIGTSILRPAFAASALAASVAFAPGSSFAQERPQTSSPVVLNCGRYFTALSLSPRAHAGALLDLPTWSSDLRFTQPRPVTVRLLELLRQSSQSRLFRADVLGIGPAFVEIWSELPREDSQWLWQLVIRNGVVIGGGTDFGVILEPPSRSSAQ